MSKSGLKHFTCPKCNTLTVDNWPLDINGVIEGGGCQECWEAECSDKWWRAIGDLITTLKPVYPTEQDGNHAHT